ncbi:g11023 [Coccomyxa viridis]|uniref:G11023 protein n=1 Tax=Coccomyxa viridis TaxID=1274662 RepID=A0ABP1G764_9CHLO
MGWSPPTFGKAERPFDPEDPYADPAALIEQRIKKTHEKMVQIEKAKVLREKLGECYMSEGVNSLQACKELALDYLQSIQGIGFGQLNSGRFDRPPPKHTLD